MPDDLTAILESTEHTLLASGLGNTEGPLWHPEGYLTFVDMSGSRLLRWDPDAGVSVVRENTGEGNGCTLDRQGRLIMCEGAGHRCITRMDAAGSIGGIGLLGGPPVLGGDAGATPKDFWEAASSCTQAAKVRHQGHFRTIGRRPRALLLGREARRVARPMVSPIRPRL